METPQELLEEALRLDAGAFTNGDDADREITKYWEGGGEEGSIPGVWRKARVVMECKNV